MRILDTISPFSFGLKNVVDCKKKFSKSYRADHSMRVCTLYLTELLTLEFQGGNSFKE